MWWRSSFWQIILNTLVLVLYSIDIQDAIEGAGWYFKVQNETRLKASGLRLPEHDGDYTKENFKIQNFRIQCITGGAFRRLPQLSSLALQHNDIAGEKLFWNLLTCFLRFEANSFLKRGLAHRSSVGGKPLALRLQTRMARSVAFIQGIFILNYVSCRNRISRVMNTS